MASKLFVSIDRAVSCCCYRVGVYHALRLSCTMQITIQNTLGLEWYGRVQHPISGPCQRRLGSIIFGASNSIKHNDSDQSKRTCVRTCVDQRKQVLFVHWTQNAISGVSLTWWNCLPSCWSSLLKCKHIRRWLLKHIYASAICLA